MPTSGCHPVVLSLPEGSLTQLPSTGICASVFTLTTYPTMTATLCVCLHDPALQARGHFRLAHMPSVCSRAQAALRGVPGPEEDTASGGFNPLQCPGSALRAVCQLLDAAQPAPILPLGGQVCNADLCTGWAAGP